MVKMLWCFMSLYSTLSTLRANLADDRHFSSFFVPHLFEEKWRDTVFGFPWGVVRGAWCVVRGSEFLVGTLSP